MSLRVKTLINRYETVREVVNSDELNEFEEDFLVFLIVNIGMVKGTNLFNKWRDDDNEGGIRDS